MTQNRKEWKLVHPWFYDLLEGIIANSGLSPRSEKVCLLRLEGKTLKEIGQELNLTVERIRQIEAKGINQILHAWRDSNSKQTLINSLREEIRTLATMIKAGETPPPEVYQTIDHTLQEMPLDEVELTVRACNALNHAKIKTIGQLVQMREEDLFHIHNCGRKTVMELREVVQELGLSLGMKITGPQYRLVEIERPYRNDYMVEQYGNQM